MAQREASGATRRRILDVALELFVEQGYDRTSLREIAERLGFSKAALYYHYKAKDDILLSLADSLMADLEDVIDRISEEPPGPERARQVLTEMVDLMLRHRRAAQLIITQAVAIQRLKAAREHAFEGRLRALLVAEDAPLVERVRASAALSVVQATLLHLQEDDVEAVRSTVLSLALACMRLEATAAGQGMAPDL